MKKILGWHFTVGDYLGHDDGRKIRIGETLKVHGEPVPCDYGLHASESALDALRYAPGPILWRVELSGVVLSHGDPVDKYAASERTAVAGGVDASEMLRRFARLCALDVIHLWDVPEIVKRYLETGDEAIRYAARYEAWDEAWYAAWYAARDEAWYAARDAARYAAAWDAARYAARYAAVWDAARAKQRERFEEMCLEFVKSCG